MNFRLVVEKDGTPIRIINLKHNEVELGRGPGNAVRIPSAEVSRKHCRLVLRDGVVTVEDLATINGTFVNGQAIVGRTLVRPGDRLDVGPVRFVVEYEPEQNLEVPELLEVDEEVPVLEPLNEALPLAIPAEVVDAEPGQTELGEILLELDNAEKETAPHQLGPKKKVNRKRGEDRTGIG